MHLNVNLNCVGCWRRWYTQQLCVCVTDEGCELWKVNAAIFLLHFSSNRSLDVFISIWALVSFSLYLYLCVIEKAVDVVGDVMFLHACVCECMCVHTPVISLCQISLVPRLGIKSKRERERSVTENVKSTVRWWWGIWISQCVSNMCIMKCYECSVKSDLSHFVGWILHLKWKYLQILCLLWC